MIANFMIPQGATQPSLEVTLTPTGQVPVQLPSQSYGCQTTAIAGVDLTDAVVSFELFNACSRTHDQKGVFGQVEVIDAVAGVVRYQWHPNDTADKGMFYGRFVVRFADNTILKWPYQIESLAIEVT